jgi:hypothetical protein
LPGIAPPQKPVSTQVRPAAAARLAASAAVSTVGGGEAFPFGAAGFVDVDVGVDEAGEQREVAEVVAAAGREGLVVVADVRDAFAGDGDGGGPRLVGEDGAAGAEHQVVAGHGVSAFAAR